MKYRKKPLVIDAIQWIGTNYNEIVNHFGESKIIHHHEFDDCLWVYTLEGQMTANIGDYIIKGIKGEFYPCKPDIFEASYEVVEDFLDV